MSGETQGAKLVNMRDRAAPAEAAPPAESPPPAKPKGRPRFASRRLLLMFVVPLVLLVAGSYLWLTGGRYVSTDNAYVQQDKLTVYPELSGTIARVAVRQNQLVRQGDMLFELDPEPSRIALEQAEAAVAAARLQVGQLRAAYNSALAARKTAEDNLEFHRSSFARQQDLLKRGVASQAAFDQEQNSLHAAEQQLAQATQQVEGARSALGGNPDIAADAHPAVMQALANRDKAELDTRRTAVKAPAAGIIAQTDRLQAGQYVTPASAVLSLVKTRESWVEANFKETDLTYMAVGQKAKVTLDAFPSIELDAVVESIGAGTGAQFSILPAQNATGNWVKVVQRVPVRVKLTDTSSIPFRVGLSASVSIDTEHRRSLPFFVAHATETPNQAQFPGAVAGGK